MSSFRLNNGFRLQKTNRAAVRWKQPPKKPFHHVSRDKIYPRFLEYFSSLGQGFLRSAVLNEEKALGTRLVRTVLGWCIVGPVSSAQSPDSLVVSSCNRILARENISTENLGIDFIVHDKAKEIIKPSVVKQMFELDFAEH